MDNAVPAQEIAEVEQLPRNSRRGTVPLPSLILRLEPLPEATARHERLRSPEPQLGDVGELKGSAPAPEVEAETAPANRAAPVAPPVPPVPSAPPLFERRPQPVPDAPVRRVVDVAAPERLTVATPLTRWSAAVAASHDACFVVDSNGILISVSVAATDLLGCGDSAVIGRHLLDVITLVDLDTGSNDPEYANRITPLMVLESPGLSRSLIRVRHDDGALVSLDTSSAPVHDVTGYTLGSVTFLSPIPRR